MQYAVWRTFCRSQPLESYQSQAATRELLWELRRALCERLGAEMYGNVMPCKELDLQPGFHSNYNHNQKIHQVTNQCHKMDEGVYPMVIELKELLRDYHYPLSGVLQHPLCCDNRVVGCFSCR